MSLSNLLQANNFEISVGGITADTGVFSSIVSEDINSKDIITDSINSKAYEFNGNIFYKFSDKISASYKDEAKNVSNIDIVCQLIGKFVIVHIPETSYTQAGGVTGEFMEITLPTGYRPNLGIDQFGDTYSFGTVSGSTNAIMHTTYRIEDSGLITFSLNAAYGSIGAVATTAGNGQSRTTPAFSLMFLQNY